MFALLDLFLIVIKYLLPKFLLLWLTECFELHLECLLYVTFEVIYFELWKHFLLMLLFEDDLLRWYLLFWLFRQVLFLGRPYLRLWLGDINGFFWQLILLFCLLIPFLNLFHSLYRLLLYLLFHIWFNLTLQITKLSVNFWHDFLHQFLQLLIVQFFKLGFLLILFSLKSIETLDALLFEKFRWG